MKPDDAYETLLSLSEPELRDRYPFGIKREGTKWVKAKRGQGERKLSRLLADKEARQEKPRYLRASYSVPRKYVENPDAKGERNDNYTLNPSKALRGPEVEEAVPEDVQTRITQEGRVAFLAGKENELAERQAKVIANKIAKLQREGLKLGLDLGPWFQQMIREAQAEIVRQRREAA